MNRTHQSNTTETCPLCGKSLGNRAAAVSHYRGHVRKGDLSVDEKAYPNVKYCASDYPYNEYFVWWERGIILKPAYQETLVELRARWHAHWYALWVNRRHGNVIRVKFNYCKELEPQSQSSVIAEKA